MQRDRFVAVLLASNPKAASFLKNGIGKIKPATDATSAEIAAVTRWVGFKTNGNSKPKATAKAAAAKKQATRKPAKPAKGDYRNSKGVLYRQVITYVPVTE